MFQCQRFIVTALDRVFLGFGLKCGLSKNPWVFCGSKTVSFLIQFNIYSTPLKQHQHNKTMLILNTNDYPHHKPSYLHKSRTPNIFNKKIPLTNLDLKLDLNSKKKYQRYNTHKYLIMKETNNEFAYLFYSSSRTKNSRKLNTNSLCN